MKTGVLAWVCLVMAGSLETGRCGIVFEGPVESAVLGTNRIVRVHLPASYGDEPARRYPVLYVQDGQNAFSSAGTNAAFGWGSWEMDRAATRLAAAGRMQEIVLVAIDCGPERYAEYRGPAYPFTPDELKAADPLPPSPGDSAPYERYRRFLVEELKPRIDREYRTLAGASNTGVLGSSLGGLCSLVLAWERPDVFGKAASLSGAFQVERTNFLARVVGGYRGSPKAVTLYLDSGVCDFTGGDDGRTNTTALVAEFKRIGWREGVDLCHFVDHQPMTEAQVEQAGLRRDKWAEAQRSQHNEFYWRNRVWRALVFLFPAKEPARL